MKLIVEQARCGAKGAVAEASNLLFARSGADGSLIE
jgi:hypothetical protein